MKNKIGIGLTIILIIAGLAAFTACGDTEMTSSNSEKYELPSKDCKMVIDESGWTYSEKDGCVYYAVVMKNKSKNYTCSSPTVKVKAFDANGEVISKEELKLPEAGPGEKVSYGSIGNYSGEIPSDIKFKVIETYDWSKMDEKNYTSSLEVSGCGIREYVDEEENSDDNYSDMDYNDEFGDIDDAFGDMDKDIQKEVEKEQKSSSKGSESMSNSDRDELMDDSESVEYYGNIINDKDCDCSQVLVCILFRDAEGNLLGGENGTVQDVKAKAETPFSIISSSGISMPDYEFSAYQW